MTELEKRNWARKLANLPPLPDASKKPAEKPKLTLVKKENN